MSNDEIRAVPLLAGADQRCEALLKAVVGLINERAIGLSVPSILSVLRLAEHSVITGRSV